MYYEQCMRSQQENNSDVRDARAQSDRCADCYEEEDWCLGHEVDAGRCNEGGDVEWSPGRRIGSRSYGWRYIKTDHAACVLARDRGPSVLIAGGAVCMKESCIVRQSDYCLEQYL